MIGHGKKGGRGRMVGKREKCSSIVAEERVSEQSCG